MYQKYNTEAIVLRSYESGEDDRTIALYTRDFGLVRVRAIGVRKEKSKMRYATQLFTLSLVSLVRGKRGWRLAGASALQSPCVDFVGRAVLARVSDLVLRLIAGEEENAYLYAALAEAHRALASDPDAPRATIELVCVARTLYALGYLSTEAFDTALFSHTAYAITHMEEAESLRTKLLESVNRAIEGTQL